MVQFLITALLSYLLICISATFGSYKSISFPGSTDWRLKGVDQSGWTQPHFGFLDPYLLGSTTRVILNFETVRPKEAGAASLKFRSLPESEPTVVTREPIEAPRTDSAQAEAGFSGEITNPFPSEGSGGQLLGAKLKKISLEPKYGVLFIKPSEFGGLILVVSLLSMMLRLSFSGTTASAARFIPSALFSLALFLVFSFSRVDHWNRSVWLWGIFLVIGLGAILSRKLRVAKDFRYFSWAYFVAFLIFIFALWIRISAVSFGLPQLYHPDESRKVKIALRISTSGDLDPRYFRHPSFMLYSTAALGKLHYLVKGEAPTLPELVVLGRSVSAVLGAASVFVIFLIGTLFFGSTSSLFAASLLAVAPLHIVCSRYIKEDASMIFFALLSLYFALRFLFRKQSYINLIASALFAGFATSTKYTGVLSLAFPLMPVGFWIITNSPLERFFDFRRELAFLKSVHPKKVLAWITLVLIIASFGFLLITPYSILNYQTFISDFTYEKAHMDRGHAGAISAWAYYWTYHLRFSVLGALTRPIGWIGILALGFLLSGIRHSSKSLIILCGFLLFYLPAEYVNAKPFPQPERYILPCIPFLALSLGWMMESIFSGGFLRISSIVQVAISALMVTLPLSYSLAHTRATLHDTRQEATLWVNSNLEAGSNILSDWYFYGPDFRYDRFRITQLKSPQGAKLLKKFSLQMLREEGFDYYITSSFFYNRYIRQVKRGNRIALGYKELFDKLRPIQSFSNEKYQYGFHNPSIKVFKIPK